MPMVYANVFRVHATPPTFSKRRPNVTPFNNFIISVPSECPPNVAHLGDRSVVDGDGEASGAGRATGRYGGGSTVGYGRVDWMCYDRVRGIL